MTMVVSTESMSSCRPRSAWFWRRLPSKANGLGDDGDGERSHFAGERGDDGRGSGAGAAAESGGDEDHVGAFEGFDDFVGVFERGFASDFGIGAGAEAVGELHAELDLDRSARELERLEVGVGDHELDAFEVRLDHAVDGVAAAAADADDLDLGAVDGVFVEMNADVVVGLLAEVFDHRLPRCGLKPAGKIKLGRQAEAVPAQNLSTRSWWRTKLSAGRQILGQHCHAPGGRGVRTKSCR